METKEGEKLIYKVAKQRAKNRQDIGEVSVIKSKEGDMLTDEKNIKERWQEYFSDLLNVENSREPLEEQPPVEDPVQGITQEEVKEAMKKMKSGKAPGCSGLTVDLLKSLGDTGVHMMHTLLEKIWLEEKVPTEWELSEIVPLYKRKGDPLECGNFRGIKLMEHAMKLLEKILEKRLRELVSVDDMQFGFSPWERNNRCCICHQTATGETP